jgi:hypothetical protein
MGLANGLLGTSGAIALITVSPLLAARGVAEPNIAVVTTIALIPTFASFVVAPITIGSSGADGYGG